MRGLAGASMEHATQALLQADLHLAGEVITDYAGISSRGAHVFPSGIAGSSGR
jgi:hypothetical protein